MSQIWKHESKNRLRKMQLIKLNLKCKSLMKKAKIILLTLKIKFKNKEKFLWFLMEKKQKKWMSLRVE